MLRKVFALTLVLLSLFIAACGEQPEKKEQKILVLYSQLEQDFTEALISSYAEQNSDYKVTAIYEVKAEGTKPDIVLAERNVLLELQEGNALQAIVSDAGDRLPVKFKSDAGLWFGAFYDPTVFLINQQYARTVGQEQLRGWFDLEYNKNDIRITMENLSSSDSSINFLTGLASNIGEAKTLNYLWNINRYIEQYAKFPFTPIRMAAVGDADIAITKQSFVSKYLENNFPAYVLVPKEGTPIDLYGGAVYKECKNVKAATDFINWLIADEAVKYVSQTIDTGYMFLLPKGVHGSTVEAETLWLNNKYLKKEQQEALVSSWLENVRFNKNN